ncbi:putative SEC-C motif domain protein [Candidatus Sulfopaludibacter sp. SbA6]|nr:putative SEC-C motif domain protein [Candidatus Sulfopaludibacter sp. SbA6]
MLFIPKSFRDQRAEILRAGQAQEISSAEAAERLLRIDPNYGPAYQLLGSERAEAGDIAEAESLFWKALDLQPSRYTCYLPLANVRLRNDPSDVLSHRLMDLAMWKLALADEIPDTIAETFRSSFGELDADYKDPKTYETLATASETTHKGDPPEVRDRLLPYRLLNDLQRQAPTALEDSLLRDILANSARCAPLFHAALRDWGRTPDALSPEALLLVVALLGEIAEVHLIDEVLGDLLELALLQDDEMFRNANWAIFRIGQRFPSQTLARLRMAASQARLVLRCALAEQMNLLPKTPGLEDALADLLDGFSAFAGEGDAPYLLMLVVDALDELDRHSQAQALLTRCEILLPPKGRRYLRDLAEAEDGFIPRLVDQEIDGLDVQTICLRRADKPERPVEPEPRVRIRPERNDPCWCGSGRKYKKCHLAADEEAERRQRPPEANQPVGEPLYRDLFDKLLHSSTEWRSRAQLQEATHLYFEQDPDELDPKSEGMGGFFEWYVYDFRPGGTGRTLVEEYLRKRGPRLSVRERAMLESWRAARFGLFEVQRVEPGKGVEMKDVFAGDRFFVADVSSSRSLVQWDCVLQRVEEFEGRRMFGGLGMLVRRELLPKLVAVVEEDSRAMGRTPADYVRAYSHRWYRVVTELHQETMRDLKMVNAEGDAIVFSSAAYEILDEEALVAALSSVKVFEDTSSARDPAGERNFGWMESAAEGQRRAYGHIQIRGGRLKLETNSRRRLEIGRQLLEKNAGSFLKHLRDSFKSAEAAMQRMSREGPREPKGSGIPPEVERELLLKLKAEHYAKWPDEHLPALDGKTPREAVRSAVGRKAVDDILRMMENREERERREGRPAFDFSPVRKTLGLEKL